MLYKVLEIIGITLIIVYLIPHKRKKKLIKNNKCKYAILIPARNEEKVIENLMESIKNQTVSVNFKDVYVIVSDNNDLSIPILKKYNCNILTRVNPNLKRKGYALDECIKSIKIKYDLYFIFDADNILKEDFISNMLNDYKEGYDISTAKRLNKNPNSNVISSSSGLIFTLINFINKLKSKSNDNVILSGTGFYISGDIINNVNGYPFNSLTEDYELTLYSTLNNYNTHYNESAKFYDEQPTSFNETIKQRTRWVKGYFENRKKYNTLLLSNFMKSKDFNILKEIIGIKGVIILLLGLIIDISLSFSIKKLFIILLLIYLTLFILTYLLLLDKSINIKKSIKLKTLFFNPIFLCSYIICLFKSFGNVSWDVIKHGK